MARPGTHTGHDLDTRPLAIVASTVSDAHTWNLVFVELVVRENGYRSLNLGPCTPVEEVVAACIELSPDLVVVSTINGLGMLDAGHLIHAIQAATVDHPPVVIGGNFGLELDADTVRTIQILGYSEVFLGESAVPRFVQYLETLKRSRSPF